MKDKRFTNNPYLIFSPFLIIMITLVFIINTDGTNGDEGRFIFFANNILHGYYSPSAPNIDLGNGPGYPILLLPFIFFRLPLVCIPILNAIFYYFSIILIFKIINKLVGFRKALIFSLFLAFYINAYEVLPYIRYETFILFLISLIAFNISRAVDPEYFTKSKTYLLLSGFFIGYLALTQPIFGYVMLVMLTVIALLLIINRKSVNYRKGMAVLIVALFVISPYLIYTYNLTDKIFYLSTHGGNNLYWMSSPYENEYGSWLSFSKLKMEDISDANNSNKFNMETFKLNHQKVFNDISKFKGIELDDTLKKIAVNNIKSHPIKFVQNCTSNLGRILFNMPYSYKAQTPIFLIRLPFNGIIIVLALFSLIPTYLNWSKIPFSLRFMLSFAIIFIGGSIMGSAETRMFTYTLPVLLIWIAFIIEKSINIKLKFDH